MTGLLFGTAGIPRSSNLNSTISGIQRIRALGLDCLEVEFVQGVNMGEATARQVNEVARSFDVALSVHAPYFINFNSDSLGKRRGSEKRLLQAARIGAICGVRSVVFHAAFYLGRDPETVFGIVSDELLKITQTLRSENIPICLRPEVTGKGTQFGTVEEILRLCLEVPGLSPCLDIAHWHARTGKFNTYDETIAILKMIESRLGRGALDDMHIHFSGISYSKKGEIKHLPLKESDMDYIGILGAMKDLDIKGRVICESPNLEEDARLLKESFAALS